MQIRRPITEADVTRTLKVIENDNVFTIDNFFLNSDLIVKLRKDVEDNYYFSVFTKDNKCICSCEFINQRVYKKVFKLKDDRNYFEPHSKTHIDYRKIGLTSCLYLYFLNNVEKSAFLTLNHTKAAKYLWMKIQNISNYKILHYSLPGKKYVIAAKPWTVKILTK